MGTKFPSWSAIVAEQISETRQFLSKVASRTGLALTPLVRIAGSRGATYEEAQVIIADEIRRGGPALLGRIGRSETDAIVSVAGDENFGSGQRLLRRLFLHPINPRKDFSLQQLGTSGFYPTNHFESLRRLSELYLDIVGEIDVFGSWVPSEQLIAHKFQTRAVIHMHFFDPFFAVNPWSSSLEGKKVLVVSPFQSSILKQFPNRELLFSNRDVLPNFEIECIQPPVTFNLGPEHWGDFKGSWFENLARLQQDIQKREFDVLIAGAGSYGLPAAAFAKKMGKVGMNLGGVTQLLFGIRGRRWDSDPAYENLANSFWIRPSQSETPRLASLVEGNSYW